MSDLLRWAWAAGVSKGYFSAATDFARIQASGVSTILLKGQTYAMPPAATAGEWGLLQKSWEGPLGGVKCLLASLYWY